MDAKKANEIRWHQADRVRAEENAIIEVMKKHDEIMLSQIENETGIAKKDLYNRVIKLRGAGMIEFVRRVGNESFYRIRIERKVDVSNMPPLYIAWGGYAA